jgi:hypothetical protein
MKHAPSKVVVFMALLYLFVISLYSQSKNERLLTARSQINARLAQQAIDTAKIECVVVDVDSSVTDKYYDDLTNPMHDPYGTLKGCFLFTMRHWPDGVEPNGITGVFKNGAILWTSDRVWAGCGGRIFATLDLNKDSTVDIVTTWSEGSHCEQESMWIYRWDGSHGVPINDFDSRGRTKMIALDFQLSGRDTNGAVKIIGQAGYYDVSAHAYIEDSVITYLWNGTKYGKANAENHTKK